MGAGMAAVFARAGCDVSLAARSRGTLEQAAARVAEISGSSARVALHTDVGEAAAGAELVVETIAEQLDAKLDVLAIAAAVAPDAILTSNTSSLPLAELGQALPRPDRFAGLHWLNPPELVELVEVVGTEKTDPLILETLAGWMSALGKAPILLRRQVPGFVVNRLQYALLREAFALVDAGICSYDDVDDALTRGLGVRWAAVGPFETMDLGGLDVFLTVARNLMPELSNATDPPAFLVESVAAEELGAKSGRGLKGDYPAERLAETAARRERIARGIAALRADRADG